MDARAGEGGDGTVDWEGGRRMGVVGEECSNYVLRSGG